MDFYSLAVIVYLLFVMYAANQADSGGTPGKPITRILMQAVIALIFLFAPFTLISMYVSTQPEAAMAPINPGSGILVAVLAVICGTIAYNAVHSETFQAWLGQRLPTYKATSLVHQTAVIHCLLIVVSSIFGFIIIGGLDGVAESLEQSGISSSSVVFEGALWVMAALLGVGFAIRRTWPETLQRLGLSLPNREETVMGVLTGAGLFVAQIIFQVVWLTLSPQTMEQQTVAAQAMSNAINSLPLALLMAASAAIGEEIIMRGALQPVFGAAIVSLFFAVLHSQYLFTPITLFIFGLSMVLARLRSRYNTSTAILAHFVYNALPFVLWSLSGGLV